MISDTIKLFLAILLQTACHQQASLNPSSKGQGAGDKASGPRGASRPIAVRTIIATAEKRPRVIETVGVLTGQRQVDVYSRASGRIAYLGPQEGSRVRQGELLFRVDRSEPGESFLATPIVSPISGWLGRWLVNSLGEQVSAQEPVVTVVDDEILKARVMLPLPDWALVSRDTPVTVTVGAEQRQGTIDGISRTADAGSGRGAITIRVPNPQHEWKAGIAAVLSLAIDLRDRIVIPASALAITDLGPFVYIIENDAARRTAVRFQMLTNDLVEVVEGLRHGSQVIVEGVNQVGDMAKVKIIDDRKGS